MSVIIFSSIAIGLLFAADYVFGYSTFGAPAEFGNASLTTCYVGGDLGVINCTGNISTDSTFVGNGSGLTSLSLSSDFPSAVLTSFTNVTYDAEAANNFVNVSWSNYTINTDFDNGSIIRNAVNDSWAEEICWDNVTNGEWIIPEYIFDVDDEDVESDLNTYVDIGGDVMTGRLTTTQLNVTGNVTIGLISSGEDIWIYFNDDAYRDEYLRWDDSADRFEFSDALDIDSQLTVTSTISTSGDIFTSGANDDLWLGNPTQESAAFQAYADGKLIITELNVTGNITMGLTSSGEDICIFFNDDAYRDESICWDDANDYFFINDALSVGSSVIGTAITSTGDIYSTGSGDDLWLGNAQQNSAPFKAYADGHLNMTGNITLTSPDGTYFNCGVGDGGDFTCT